MIISASRRTDLPAFYTPWLLNRLRAGYCTVPNPFNPRQVARVSLTPEDVEVLVFWTRHPRPLMAHLTELDERGYRYCFHYTLMNNPRLLDPKTPSLPVALETFCELARRIGPERVIWRYDPIVLSRISDTRFHRETYEYIARRLRGYTYRSVISFVDLYRKADRRLRQLARQGGELIACERRDFDELLYALARAARENGMEIVSCAEEMDWRPYGIQPGKCIDDEYMARVLGIHVTARKDPAQRAACGCVVSQDIGMYDSCLFGCQYCYAVSSFERARFNYHVEHHPDSPSLLGWHEA